MRRVLLLALLLLFALPIVGWLALPSPWALRFVAPDRTSFMLYRLREARRADTTLTLEHRWIPLDSISPALVRAVLVAEDDRFREHGGVDWRALGEEVRYRGDDDFSWGDPADRAALAEALRYGWENRSEIRGRSTLTQQLARNLFWTPHRSVLRKGMEMVVAWRLEFWLSKDRILELYLNAAELGEGVFGVEAAAQRYFGVSAADLTRFQAASLAATLPHPRTSNPGHRPGRMAWRRDLILRRLGGEAVEIPAAPDPVELTLPAVDVDSVERPEGLPPVDTSGAGVGPEGGAGAGPADSLPPPDTVRPDTVGGDDYSVTSLLRSTFPDPRRGSSSSTTTVLGTL